MATLTLNQDGTGTLLFTAEEQETCATLPPDQLEGYITLWLQHQTSKMLHAQLDALTPQEKAEVMNTLKHAGKKP